MHKKGIFLALTFIFQYFFVEAQVEKSEDYLPFKIVGSINADTGKIFLQTLFYSEYYPEDISSLESVVKNGKFTFEGKIPYPQAYTLEYGENYYSETIVIEAGTQSVTVNIDSSRKVPAVDNHVMTERDAQDSTAQAELGRKFADFDRRWKKLSQEYDNEIPDSIGKSLQEARQSYYDQADSLLLEYVKRHPNSYRKLWNFIRLFSGWGYEEIFDSIYHHFSDSLRLTHAGRVLGENLEIGAKMATGKAFPVMPVKNQQNLQLVDSILSAGTYTLVDFWYSRCKPCFAQFPHLKTTFERYREKGFRIIGISTDKEEDRENWLKAIDEQQLKWLQYWDKDGLESAKLSIRAFPTNFLLDENGKILKKNISPAALELYLQENLK